MSKFLKENKNLVIRRARTEDAVELNGFYRHIILETDHFGYEVDEFHITDEQQEHTINMYNQADNAILLVATLDDKIVGNLSFRAGSSKKFQHVGEFGVQVLKDYWNLGIGKELVKYLINWARENETIYKISLRVRADNKSAIHLYKTLGFMEEGILKGEMKCNGIMYDLIYMGIVVD
ncbi:GNAT family N-acetyltransferase [Clostridium folliculivorans]|uniref:Acetyltransferase n=1 Tax=Clostridium folliculivorans TaxID=2886038 RepID=A0A9W6DCH2_9CLOT|nr:GNAT family protein [Clostridium folliculivorans]GKU27495.1 acetyltransferase [Clostridium folliculivorans]GKU32345.1 acetyltransferase [Clostridium folliculivorans]